MSAVYDAVITAAGRLKPSEARRYGTDIKALVSIGGVTLLDVAIRALRGLAHVERIAVVGPAQARSAASGADVWIDELHSGEENLLAALRCARTERAVFVASDLPFIGSHHVQGLIELTPDSVDCAYPIFTREEFEREHPGARSSYARLADGEWTGGSVFVLRPEFVMRNERLLRRAFAARKNLLTLAGMLGPVLALRYARNQLRVSDVAARIERLTGGSVLAVRGAHAALAMDCDEAADFEYAIARAAGAPRDPAPRPA